MGAWIEIPYHIRCILINESLPLWERGLKSLRFPRSVRTVSVAPLVGAWIEIDKESPFHRCRMSLPLWERGLKSVENNKQNDRHVAPLVGAWIEILNVPFRIITW